jgi:hypothetical protein
VQKRLERNRTRPQDMPKCVDCDAQTKGVAISGYDGKWRCWSHNDQHNAAVLRESGEAPPLPSDETIPLPARIDAMKEKARQDRAAKVLDKYGLTKRGW